MSQYLTYGEYVSYGGDLDASDFPVYELRARKQIDLLTDSRVASMSEVPEAVKLCMMQAIRVEQKYGIESQAESPMVASFSTDGYSESYGSAEEQIATIRKNLFASMRSMLYGETDDRGVPLLYRGVMDYADD